MGFGAAAGGTTTKATGGIGGTSGGVTRPTWSAPGPTPISATPGSNSPIGGCTNPVPRTPPTGPGKGWAPCPPGTTPNPQNIAQCCGGKAAGGSIPLPGLGGITMPGVGGAGGTGPTATPWNPKDLERPALKPINPQAAYDPKIAEALAAQTQYGSDIKAGTGFAQDVLSQRQLDTTEAEIARMRQEAAAQGVPFNEQEARTQLQQSLNKTMADVTLQREQMYGQALGAQAGTAGVQAGERTSRMGIDLQAQQATMQNLIDRYGKDVQKYGYDAQAATAANNALMSFYAQLMGGMFGMLGQLGGGGMSYDQGSTYYG